MSFVFIDEQDGTIPPVPSENRRGGPEDFSDSAALSGAEELVLTDQGRYDEALGTAHLGIVNSPETWSAALEFLTRPEPADHVLEGPAADPSPVSGPGSHEGADRTLPVTGGPAGMPSLVAIALVLTAAALIPVRPRPTGDRS